MKRDVTSSVTPPVAAAPGVAGSQMSAAYTGIKDAIIRCRLHPGQQISESYLAEMLGLGVSPVRSALQRLRQEKLVYAVARHGHVVAPIRIQDIRDIFEVRRYLELPAVRRAAITGHKHVQRLRALDEACHTARYDTDDSDALDRFLQANTALHLGVVATCENQQLVDFLGIVLERMERLFHFALQFIDRNDEMYHEHHGLVEAVITGDGQRAYEEMAEQITSSERMVFEALLISPQVASLSLEMTSDHNAEPV